MTIVFHELVTRQMEPNAPYTTWTCENNEILEILVSELDQ